MHVDRAGAGDNKDQACDGYRLGPLLAPAAAQFGAGVQRGRVKHGVGKARAEHSTQQLGYYKYNSCSRNILLG